MHPPASRRSAHSDLGIGVLVCKCSSESADHTRAPLTSKEDAALLKEMKVRRFISDSNGYLTRALLRSCGWPQLDWGGVGPIAQRKSNPWYTLGTFEHQYAARLAQGLANCAGATRPRLLHHRGWRPLVAGENQLASWVRWRYHGIAADGRCKSCRPTAFRRVRPPEER